MTLRTKLENLEAKLSRLEMTHPAGDDVDRLCERLAEIAQDPDNYERDNPGSLKRIEAILEEVCAEYNTGNGPA